MHRDSRLEGLFHVSEDDVKELVRELQRERSGFTVSRKWAAIASVLVALLGTGGVGAVLKPIYDQSAAIETLRGQLALQGQRLAEIQSDVRTLTRDVDALQNRRVR